MKNLEKILNLIPENVSEAQKNGIMEFIKESIVDAADEWKEKVTESDNKLTEAQETIEDLRKGAKASDEKLGKLEDELAVIKAESEAQARESKFQERMGSITDDFELSESELARVATKIKELDDEAYADWHGDFSEFADSKKKTVIAEAENEVNELKKELDELKVSKASVETPEATEAAKAATEEADAEAAKKVLDDAKEEADQIIANAQQAEEDEETLLAKNQKAFRDSIKIEI